MVLVAYVTQANDVNASRFQQPHVTTSYHVPRLQDNGYTVGYIRCTMHALLQCFEVVFGYHCLYVLNSIEPHCIHTLMYTNYMSRTLPHTIPNSTELNYLCAQSKEFLFINRYETCANIHMYICLHTTYMSIHNSLANKFLFFVYESLYI